MNGVRATMRQLLLFGKRIAVPESWPTLLRRESVPKVAARIDPAHYHCQRMWEWPERHETICRKIGRIEFSCGAGERRWATDRSSHAEEEFDCPRCRDGETRARNHKYAQVQGPQADGTV